MINMTNESLIKLKDALETIGKFCSEGDSCYSCPFRESRRGCPLQQKHEFIHAILFELATPEEKLDLIGMLCKAHNVKLYVPFVLGDTYGIVTGVYVFREDGLYLYGDTDNKPQTLTLAKMYNSMLNDGYEVICNDYKEPDEGVYYV